tara:strand:- start:2752 stop:3174 length:423 start_codon:yes stop_codon:yes gene_type:complete
MRNYLFLLPALLFLLISIMNMAKATGVAPMEIKGARTISTATAKLLLDKGYPFIDVRGNDDFNRGHIPGASHLSVKSEAFTTDNLRKIVDKDKVVIFYCNGAACMGSSIASKKAIEWGWTRILYYRAGFKEWKENGLAIQ